jgi:predicted metal-binding membrane protein
MPNIEAIVTTLFFASGLMFAWLSIGIAARTKEACTERDYLRAVVGLPMCIGLSLLSVLFFLAPFLK